MTDVTRPVLRYHGAKFRLAPWIIGHFPPHQCYVEPFGGAAGVLLQKSRAYAEVYNDLDGEVANFFRVLRGPETRAQLIEAVIFTPYHRDEFEHAWEPSDDPIESARRLCIRAQMGFGSAGATKSATGFRIDTKREYGTAQQLWAYYPSALAEAGQRLSGVLIENRQAIEVMLAHDGPSTLHFVDPPYLHSTRVMNSSERYYRHEMSDEDHIKLLETLLGLEGMVVLSGYSSDLYSSYLAGWETRSTDARIAAGRGAALRQEVVWLNPACSRALQGTGLFQDMCA
ncbi:DNA adenine methylase [Chromobacterium haemolyticum]|uniref:DNA adenine methylase n=1 Tax=Chromobacterium haemolyticum TaxID=394935 RepID=UPI0024495648|nr:DNA adenine methylase [Chromobacterium haemolyticum]MDH0342087.1 DNA adenine methylase [Chromobacterium haemolyticum]